MASKSASTVYKPDPAHRVVVLHGKESFLLSEYLSQIRRVMAEAFGDVDVVRFDGSMDEPADILDECRSFGLMQQHKIVLVDNADQAVKEAARPLFIRYAKAPCASATLVLRAERWHKSKLDDAIKGVGAIVKCDATDSRSAARWAIGRCKKQHGAILDKDAADALVERVGPALARLDAELGKLALAAEPGDPPRVTAGVVAEFVGRTREQVVWDIQRALLTGEPAIALAQLHAILDNAPTGANIPVSWACMDLARKLHAYTVGLKQGEDPFGLAKALKVWPREMQDAIVSRSRDLSPAQAAHLLAHAVEADLRQKTGVGRADRTLERLALRFTSPIG
ncbi:MAG: DNA polymerase III subunit delta [Planctomycetes bacterium]|nr:DNA polymerase III subunit delta [Planctomycetota bacterium]